MNHDPAGLAPKSAPERRKEQRSAATGTVDITVTEPTVARFEGELLDISPSGFRIKHEFPGLVSGASVRFRHPRAQGEARVMWTRILGSHVETGFLVR